MKKTIKSVLANPLMAGSAIIFLGTFVGNIFNFLFNFFMTRNLSVSDYGTVASLVSIILLFSFAASSFVPTIVHFASFYFANKQIGKAIAFFWKLNIFFVIFGAITLMSFVVAREQLGYFFKISNTLSIFIVGIIVLFIFINTLNSGMLNAQLSFKYISFLNFFSAVVKLLSGILFVLSGLGVVGAMLGFLLGGISHYLFSFIPLRFLFKNKSKEVVVNFKKILEYAAPSSMAMLGSTLFITTDTILVKHFYSSEAAGIYAGMSLLGRIIYFLSAPISLVLFPLVAHRHARNEKHKHLFLMAFILVFLSSASITIFYYFFPEFSIQLLLKQKEYLLIKDTLWIFGVFMMTYSLLWLVVNYFLSIKKTNVFAPILAGALFQIVALWFYHGTFLQVITISTIGTTAPLLGILLYYGIIRVKK